MFIICAVLILIPAPSLDNETGEKNTGAVLSDTSSNFLDGNYEGCSRDGYTGENFWGHIKITVESGSFTDIWFTIRDSSLHEPVDSMYGVNHYSGSPLYMQQCVEDGHGIEIYPQLLMESQSLDAIDAITGATWSCNIFIASAEKALEGARIHTHVDENPDHAGALMKIVPNPFHSELAFEYNVSEPCFVKLSVYNSEGRLIKHLVNQEQQAGHYSISWNDCSSDGVYFGSLSTGNKVYCSKLVRAGR